MKVLKVHSRDEYIGELRFDEKTRKWSVHPLEAIDTRCLQSLLEDPVADENLDHQCTAYSDPEGFMKYARVTHAGSGIRVGRAFDADHTAKSCDKQLLKNRSKNRNINEIENL